MKFDKSVVINLNEDNEQSPFCKICICGIENEKEKILLIIMGPEYIQHDELLIDGYNKFIEKYTEPHKILFKGGAKLDKSIKKIFHRSDKLGKIPADMIPIIEKILENEPV